MVALGIDLPVLATLKVSFFDPQFFRHFSLGALKHIWPSIDSFKDKSTIYIWNTPALC